MTGYIRLTSVIYVRTDWAHKNVRNWLQVTIDDEVITNMQSLFPFAVSSPVSAEAVDYDHLPKAVQAEVDEIEQLDQEEDTA